MAGGPTEDMVKDQVEAKQRIEAWEMKQARYKLEERNDLVQEQVRKGQITAAEAQKRLARQRMHEKAEDTRTRNAVDEAAAAGAGYATTHQVLEEILDTDYRRTPCLRWLKQVTGFAWLERKANFSRDMRRKKDYKPNILERITKSNIFEGILGFFVCINGVLIGVQASIRTDGETRDWPSTTTLSAAAAAAAAAATTSTTLTTTTSALNTTLAAGGGAVSAITTTTVTTLTTLAAVASGPSASEGIVPESTGTINAYAIFEHLFTAVFVLEILARLAADWVWIMSPLNLADVLLILLTGVMPMWILIPLHVEGEFIRPFQVLRILRLVRLIRIVRLVPIFRVLWTLLSGLMDSGRTLFWTYVLLTSVLYIFSVFGIHLIGKDEALEDDPWAQEYFGDVPRTLVTLFQTLTLDSWTIVARPLMKKSQWVAPYFIMVIMVVTLALVNLITAVIVRGAQDATARDHELMAAATKDAMMKEIDELKDLFAEIDTDGSGYLTEDEYYAALDPIFGNDNVKQKFEILQLGKDEQEEIWELLDCGNKQVSVEQFAHRLRDLQGEAKAKDSFTIVKKITYINIKLGNLSTRLKKQQEHADSLRQEVAEAHRLMGGLLLELREVLVHLSVCIPPDPARRQHNDFTGLENLLRQKLKSLEDRSAEEAKDAPGAAKPAPAAKEKPRRQHIQFEGLPDKAEAEEEADAGAVGEDSGALRGSTSSAAMRLQIPQRSQQPSSSSQSRVSAAMESTLLVPTPPQ